MALGIPVASVAKILKSASNDDAVTIRAEENADNLTFIFEAAKGDRVTDYEMKLINIECESFEIPDTEYDCVINMPSLEFARLCQNLGALGCNLLRARWRALFIERQSCQRKCKTLGHRQQKRPK
jgi:proliferating cell nuclear antigen